MILREYHIFSQDDVSSYFHKFFKAEKGVNFLPPTKFEKKSSVQGLNFCPPTGTSPPTSTSPNWYFPN